MGFEQLAGLKEQLAKQAKATAKPTAKPMAKPVTKPMAKPMAKPVAKQARARRPAPELNQKPVKAVAPAAPPNPVLLAIRKLQKRFPSAFPKNSAPKVPLKVGVFEELLGHAAELGLSEKELRDAIKTWCRGSRYWNSLVEGAVRVDLAGAEAGRVLARDAARALTLEKGRLARAASKTQNSGQAAPEEKRPAQV